MRYKKRIIIALASIVLIVALLISSYNIRQNQYKAKLFVSDIMNNEENNLTAAESKTKLENKTKEDEESYESHEIEDELESPVEPSPKLDKMYEDAMLDSDLNEVEKESIRSLVWKENKTFEDALQIVRPGSRVVYEETEVQTVANNQQTSTTTQVSNKDSNIQKPTSPDKYSELSEEDRQTALATDALEEKYAAMGSLSFEKKREVLIAGIEELKAKFPGYDTEWDIVAKEFYSDEEIRTQNPLDQLCVLEMYADQRAGKPPMKYMHEYEMCEWKHMPTFTSDMSEHDPKKCCICTPELKVEEEHQIQYSERWSVL